MIKIEGVDPNLDPDLRPQQSGNEEGPAPRAKPQPNRCRDRLNHPLFMSPDPASLPSHERTPSPEKAMQTDAAQSGANLVVPDNATTSDPRSLRLAIPNGTNKADKGRHLSDHIHLTQPLRCPVRICSKTFKSRNDFDDHKSVCITLRFINKHPSRAQLGTESREHVVAQFGNDIRSEDPFISLTVFCRPKRGYHASIPLHSSLNINCAYITASTDTKGNGYSSRKTARSASSIQIATG